MKSFKCYFLLLPLILSTCTPQSKTSKAFLLWEEHLSVEQNIAKNAIPMESNEDFSFLDDIVRNRSVLILGEEGHSDYMTSIVKLKMIDYLKNKGFKSIAFEGYSILLSYIFSNPKYSELTKNWNPSPFLGSTDVLINDTDSYKSFIALMKEGRIKVWGFDCYSSFIDIEAVKAILDENANGELLSVDWPKLKDLYFRKFLRHYLPYYPTINPSKLTVTEQYGLMRMIDSISNHTQYLIHLNGSNKDLKVVLQWIRNLNTTFSGIEVGIEQVDEPIFQLHNRNRDIQMAENLDWIIENFPDEKIVVWCANFHCALDISQTRYSADSLLYFTFQSTGEFLAAKHREKMYSMAFTSSTKWDENDRGMLEKEIDNTIGTAQFAFIDFEPLRFAAGYRDKKFESNVILKKQGKWLYIFDGLYYIQNQDKDHSKDN